MRTFVVCFDATIAVRAEAEEETEARRLAEEVLSRVDVEGRLAEDGLECTLGEIYLVEDREGGEEIRM